ncbi:lipoprotein-anchoring transpeptidase ErfK/SrfK [Microvirga flocculans]|uniref:Lipoprotein-anchoring transpeptidase ErfK/SrfK n=1 Tax=Microvirga flocculans TaxID=217168 RepID=A0A7W6IFP9_9HYPH|nr:L,D-transpeptidase [Microvirga flocculans]MBB4040030.1 lipoprotein-anchoring transpeptidase ErfK/SrfK [Microvirga flocculans]
MRAWIPCTAMLLALLSPAAATAQSTGRTVYYYGNSYAASGYDYPYARAQDGYDEDYPLVTRPASRTRVYRVERMAGYPYETRSSGSAVASLPQDYGTGAGYGGGIGYAIAPQFQRQLVAYRGGERPGTIIIDTDNKYLYLVQSGDRAIRYGIGVGRPGFEWAGRKTVSMKREWPSWRPPVEMLKRRPDLPRYMPGGPDNPLGARALYLGSSLYRIHGTNEPHTIGQAVSSGCIRMLNEDVVDLYNRVSVGTTVIVI